QKTELADRANLLLDGQLASGNSSSLAGLRAAVNSHFSLVDASLQLVDLPDGGIELRSPRVFLEPPIVAAAQAAQPGPRTEALTYFVNALRGERKATPYSMVTAVTPGAGSPIPEDLKDDEIVVTQWEADDIQVAAGSALTLKYYVM